jgi:D-aminoacyl-tRNA deacylase
MIASKDWTGSMKAVLQRVSSASVVVEEQQVGAIEHGFMILLGVEQGDTEEDSVYLAQKTAELRVFADQDGKMNLSIKDVNGSVLVVSQFTLIADWRKGRRPGFTRAAAPGEGERLYLHFAECLRKQGISVQLGVFGADMKVALVNDGPVTLLLENQFAPVVPQPRNSSAAQ